jgi:hypothetical protein
MADNEPTTDVACSDPELSEELRDALVLLRDRSDNDSFRALVDDLLVGRCSLLEASGTAAFSDVVFARIAQEFNELTEDEKRNLVGQSEPSSSAGSCGIPCAGCPGLCATPRDSRSS